MTPIGSSISNTTASARFITSSPDSIYFDGPHVSNKTQRLGHIEFFSGEVIYGTKSYHEAAFRSLVEPAIAAILQPEP